MDIGIKQDIQNRWWIVVVDDEQTQAKILDYSMRWGIECLFPDLKGRGLI
jgi:hypothetical protein